MTPRPTPALSVQIGAGWLALTPPAVRIVQALLQLAQEMHERDGTALSAPLRQLRDDLAHAASCAGPADVRTEPASAPWTPDDQIGTAEAAELLGVTREHAGRLARAHLLGPTRIVAGRRTVSRTAVLARQAETGDDAA